MLLTPIARSVAKTLLIALFGLEVARAQPLVSIETVTVGDVSNSADTVGVAPGSSGYGSVEYRYRIGKYEVTIGQYATFLNAVAKSDPYGLYNTNMGSVAYSAGILRSGASGSFVYDVIGPIGNKQIPQATASNRPITFVSWFDAARFANWLHNGATSNADTENGAYTLTNGQNSGIAPARNNDAKWWIPTESEWYKSAYYKGDGNGTNAGYWLYATQSDLEPWNFLNGATNCVNITIYSGGIERTAVTGGSVQDGQNYLTDVGSFVNSASAYGTYDQTGNVEEWNDLDAVSGPVRGIRGGSWSIRQGLAQSGIRSTNTPSYSTSALGFRLAAVALDRPLLPRISSSSFATNGFSVAWTPASDVCVQRRFSLSEGQWVTLSRGVTSSSYVDEAPPSTRAFYRLLTP